MIVTIEVVVLLASSVYRPEVLLNIVQCKGQSLQGKELSRPNVNSAEAKKPGTRWPCTLRQKAPRISKLTFLLERENGVSETESGLRPSFKTLGTHLEADNQRAREPDYLPMAANEVMMPKRLPGKGTMDSKALCIHWLSAPQTQRHPLGPSN